MKKIIFQGEEKDVSAELVRQKTFEVDFEGKMKIEFFRQSDGNIIAIDGMDQSGKSIKHKVVGLFPEIESCSDTPKCTECEGRTALITGTFYYSPDAEPYNNGIEEQAGTGEGDCWVGGYKCDNCSHVQGLWHE